MLPDACMSSPITQSKPTLEGRGSTRRLEPPSTAAMIRPVPPRRGAGRRLRSSFRYEIVRPLGEGGAARTFLAYEYDSIKTFRPVAIKMLHTPEDEELQKTFILEATLMRLMDHPNILQVHGFEKGASAMDRILSKFGITESFESFMIMEYIQGVNLEGFLHLHARRGIHVHPNVAAAIVSRVARGLAYAHTFRHPGISLHGIVHRDVTPTNVLFHENGRVKLTDFGIAYPFNPVSRTPLLCGTPAYIAPEVLQGEIPTPVSDIYSAGLLLEYLLVGQSRYTLPDKLSRARYVRYMRDQVRAWNFNLKVFQHVPARLAEICRNATTTKPAVRYQSASDLALDLELFLRESGSVVGPQQFEMYLGCIQSPDPGQYRSREIIPVTGKDAFEFKPLPDKV